MEKSGTVHHITRIARATVVPLVGLGLAALLDSRIRHGDVQIPNLDKAVSIACILLGVGLAYRLICLIALDLVLARATGRQVPKILKHIIGIGAGILALLLSVNVVYSGAFTSLGSVPAVAHFFKFIEFFK